MEGNGSLILYGEVQGWNNDTTYGPFGGMGFQDSSAVTVEATMQELGMPVMEIFVRRDSNGKLQRQACVVMEADKQGDADGDATTALDLLSGGATPFSAPDPALARNSIISMCCLLRCFYLFTMHHVHNASSSLALAAL